MNILNGMLQVLGSICVVGHLHSFGLILLDSISIVYNINDNASVNAADAGREPKCICMYFTPHTCTHIHTHTHSQPQL